MADNSDKENENEPSGSNIKVVVKLRPLLEKEIDERLTRHWNLDLVNRQVWSADTPHFTFDDVFDENSNTQHLYDQFAKPIVEATVNGINGTIFAYGQTASGKTYTIMGNKSSPGIIPLAIHNIFNLIKSKSDRDFLIRVSFIEIYNEKIKDLLDVNNTDLKIREDYNGFISVSCKEKVVISPEEVLNIMYEGNQGRSVGETIMNENSSRSHSIFQIIIESRKHVSPESESDVSVNVSQLNLVDLAGSERAWQAGNTKSFREGCHINKSLTTLSLVIRQLSNNEETNRFINYRDSKLTRILQSSLGGNAKTGIICTITPTSFEESHSTLKFAMCAKAVQNKPRVNTVSDATEMKVLSKHIEKLKKELESKKNLEEDNLKLQQQISKLSAQILMGNKEVVKRNTSNRRQTWWGQLTTISENDSQSVSKNERNFPNLKKNELRFSNLTERSSGAWGDRDSLASSIFDLSFEQNKKSFTDDIVVLESDDESNDKTIPGLCSPNHRCFDIYKTPPCILRAREKSASKELKELQEMTSLEKQYGSSVTEYIKEAKESKAKLLEANSELEAIKTNESNLHSQIESLTKSNKEFENIKIQLHKQVNDLKCENEGLSYQLETSKKTHKAREKELLISLEDARKSNGPEKCLSNNTSRMSQIPIFLPEIRKKESNNDNLSDETIEQQPAFIQKMKELQDQILLNNSLKQKIEEFEFKLNISNDQLKELSDKNNDLLNKINDLQINVNTKDHKICHYEQQISACEASISDILKNKAMSEESSKFEILPEIQSLMSEYVRVNKENQEKEQIFNGLKEKIIDLENANNEIILTVDHLTKNIFDLCPILNSNSDLLQINLENVDISLFNVLKNIVKLAKNSYDQITKAYSGNNFENSANDAYTSIIEPEINNMPKREESLLECSVAVESLSSSTIINNKKEDINEDFIKKSDLSESIKYLEDVLLYFEKSLMKMLPNPEEDSDNHPFEKPGNVECSPIFETIRSKFENVDHLYHLFMDETDKRFSSLENENAKLVGENQSLKLELQNGLRSIRELLLESELLHKKVLAQRNEQQIANAEFSLMTSHVNAMNHYHGCLHATCDSTFSYIKQQLIQLQTCLQNSSVTNDITSLLESSYDDIFSQSELANRSIETLIDDNDLINITAQKETLDENKEKLDTANKLVETKISENKVLHEKIQELQSKIITLENENGALSDELMEYLQEADDVNKNLVKECKNVSINTSVVSEKKLYQSPMKNSNLFISQIESDLISIFNLLKIDYTLDSQSTEVKINIIKNCIQKCLRTINEIFTQQSLKSEMIDEITRELELKNLKVDEVVSHSEQLNKQIQDLMDNNSKISFDLENMTSKYEMLSKTESNLEIFNSESQEQINNLNLDIESLRSELNQIKEISDSKQRCVEDLERKMETLKTEISLKNVDLHNLTDELKISSEKVATYNALIVELYNSLQINENKNLEIENLMESEGNDFNNKLSKITQFWEDLSLQNSYKSEKISELENENKILVDKLQCYSDVEISELNSNIEELEVELLSVKQNCDGKQKQIDDLTVQVESLNSEISSKTTNLQLLTSQINALNEEISVYKTNDVESKLNIDLENALQNLQQKNFEAIELNKRLSEIEKLYENILLENSAKNAKIVELENDKITKEKSNLNSNDKISLLNSKIEELEVELSSVRQNCDAKQKCIDDYIVQVRALKDEMCSKNTVSMGLSSQILTLNEEISTHRVNDEEYKLKIEDLNNKLLKNKATFDEITSELSNKDEKICELETKIETLQSQSNSENQLIGHLENEISTIQNKLSSYESSMIKKEEEIKILKEKLVSDESLVDKLNNEIHTNMNQKNLIAKLEEQLKTSELGKLCEEKRIEQTQADLKLKFQSEMQLQMNSYEQKIGELQRHVKSFESQNNIKDTKMQKMKEYISQINKDFKVKFDQETLSKMELQNQIDVFRMEISGYKNEIKTLNAEMLNSVRGNQESERLLTEKQREINYLKKSIDQSNVQLLEMKQNAKMMDEKIEKLKNECKLYICQINSKSGDELKLKEELKMVKDRRDLLETNLKSYEYENNVLKSKLSELDSVYKREMENKNDLGKLKSTIETLNDQILNIKNENDSKGNEIDRLQFEVKSLLKQIKEYNLKESELKESLEIIQNEKIAVEKKLEEVESKTNIGANKNLGVNTEFMEYFVDKMTYEMEQEKCKQLQKVNNDLQSKNKDLLAEMRRLRHSLQNNTLSNLLPNESRQSSDQIALIQQLQSQLSEKDNHIKKLNVMQNEEFNKCNKKLMNAESQCNELHKENAMLKARLSNCEMELEESKENSQLQERKKRRQSLYDTNRGCISPMSNTKNDNEINILDNKQYDVIEKHQQVCQNCQKNDQLLKEYERIKARNSELEARSVLSPTNRLQPHLGSGIVMNQKLCEYMADNQRLREVNTKLKELCRMRDRRIKEMESGRKS